MNVSNYFNKLLNETFPFLQDEASEKLVSFQNDDYFYQISEDISVDFDKNTEDFSSTQMKISGQLGGTLNTNSIPHVTTNLSGNESVELKLLNIKSSQILTGNGNDFVEITQSKLTNAPNANEITTHAGNDFISVNANTIGKNQYSIFSGSGNDKIVLSGNSDDRINSGTGDDMILAGLGFDIIDGEEGLDVAIFEGNIEQYDLDLSNVDEVVVTNKNDDLDINIVKNIEQLIFADGAYILGQNRWLIDDIAQDLVTTNPYSNPYLNSYNYSFDYSYLIDGLNNESNNPDNNGYDLSQPIQNPNDADSHSDNIIIDDWSENEEEANLLINEFDDSIRQFAPENQTPQFELTVRTGSEEASARQDIADYLKLSGLPFDMDEVLFEKKKFHETANDRHLGMKADEVVIGNENTDYIFGGGGNDILVGNEGHDFLVGDRGNDILVGGSGIDTAVYHGMSRDFILDLEKMIITDTNGEHGTDVLSSVERIMFLDGLFRITHDKRIELIEANPLARLPDDALPPHLQVTGKKPDPDEIIKDPRDNISGDIPSPEDFFQHTHQMFVDMHKELGGTLPEPPEMILAEAERRGYTREELEQEMNRSYESMSQLFNEMNMGEPQI